MRVLITCLTLMLAACSFGVQETPVQTVIAATIEAGKAATQTAEAAWTATSTATPIPTQTPPPTQTRTPLPEPFTVLVLIDATLEDGDFSILEAWLAYARARSNWVLNNLTRDEVQEGVHIPHYEEEIAGRKALAEFWLKQDGTVADEYLDELALIFQAGYMDEYVWDYYRSAKWTQPETGLDTDAFRAWMRTNLPRHQAETRAKIEISFEPPVGDELRGR